MVENQGKWSGGDFVCVCAKVGLSSRGVGKRTRMKGKGEGGLSGLTKTGWKMFFFEGCNPQRNCLTVLQHKLIVL